MTKAFHRMALLALAGSSALTPALAQQATGTTPTPPPADEGAIVITAQKREESLQDVPLSVQALGTRKLDQLNISNFEEYTKQLPSVSFQTSQPGSTVVYMRGVATGGDGNHSGSLPSVGTYLDEQPVTTIGGTLDVHIYDVARIESLAGPQGTLYGASSQAGTIRIITNKPALGKFEGRADAELNKVAHGGLGGKVEGMINFPIGAMDNAALRITGFWKRGAGYIDNVAGRRSYFNPTGAPFVSDNRALIKDDINELTTYGLRAALRVDLDENWTITPSIMHQKLKTKGVFFMDEDQADLKVQRFIPEVGRDKFTQIAATIEGKLAMFDVTYAGAYLSRPTYGTSDYSDYTDAYENYYISLGLRGLLDYQTYQDNAGNNINPRQQITGTNHFKKMSHEVRLSTPNDKPFRLLVGAFMQRQSNDIFQNYQVPNLATSLSVPGYAGTIWLTKQKRVDKDYALFGEANVDIGDKLTLTAGGRLFKYDNSLIGFAGFGPGNPGGFSSGYRRCLTANGLQLRFDPTGRLLVDGGVPGTPCTNVGNVENGQIVPRRSKGDGFTHRLSAQFKPVKDVMFYATWSRGFRPGGINRQPDAPAYQPDYLTNYELGWKTSFGPVRWNGAIYRQRWDSFQYSFLGANSLTVIANGRDAKVRGVETDINYSAGGFTLSASAAYTDARTKGNICRLTTGNDACSGAGDRLVTPDGTRLPVTPKFKAAATARYAWPMGPGRAHVQAGVAYQSSASVDIRRNIGGGVDPNGYLGRIKESTLVDLFAGYDWRRQSIQLFVTNLFDERNELSRFVSCSICTRTHIVPGRPRTIGIRLGTKF